MKNDNWGILSQKRNVLYGLATISIMVFHYTEDVLNASLGGVSQLFSTFYETVFSSIGVEVFVLLSGIGLYFSLEKNPSVKEFYRKRLFRILLPSLFFTVPYWILRDLLVKRSLLRFLLDVSFVTFFTEGVRTFWFVLFLLFAYALYPVIYQTLKKWGISGKATLLVLSLGCPLLFRQLLPDFYGRTEILLCRFFPLVLGAALGDAVYRRREMKGRDVLFLLSGAVLYVLSQFPSASFLGILGMRNIKALYGLSLIFLLALTFERFPWKRGEAVLSVVGTYSYELYLSHVAVRSVLNSVGLPTYHILHFALCLVLSVLFVLLFSYGRRVLLRKGKEATR